MKIISTSVISDIDVETKDGVVNVHGQVDSDVERKLASTVSASVKGAFSHFAVHHRQLI